MAYNAHSGRHSKEIKPLFTRDVFPISWYVMDKTGHLRTPMVADKVLKIERIDPDQPADFDRSEPLARVGISHVAADLFDADLQDLRHLVKGQQRLALICRRRTGS